MSAIAILGATGHIGQALADEFAGESIWSLLLLAREPGRITKPAGTDVVTGTLDMLSEIDADIIVNCIGAGDPARVWAMGAALGAVTARYDRMCLDYLKRRPNTLYVFISSGAVHGHAIGRKDWYAETKREAETRHRSIGEGNIVDLRLYGFVSPFMDLSGRFFLAEVFSAIRDGRTLMVSNEELYRDYVHPADLAQLIACCSRNRPVNRAIEVYSCEPVSKTKVLKFCAREFGLRTTAVAPECLKNPASSKVPNYYSTNRWASSIGYQPEYSAEQAVAAVGHAILSGKIL